MPSDSLGASRPANPEPPEVDVRRATADDAQAIGAVFDAAVRAGWTYLGELAEKPMFAPEDWDRLVAEHASPNILLVATDQAGQVIGERALAVYARAGYRPDGSTANRTSEARRSASCA
jgi:hypothetical protein